MFQISAPFDPAGDQPQAIDALVKGLRAGTRDQVLMGVTGSGKTFTMANIIQNVGRPTLVISHNKDYYRQAVLRRPKGTHVIDLVRLFKDVPDDPTYHGISW